MVLENGYDHLSTTLFKETLLNYAVFSGPLDMNDVKMSTNVGGF